IDDLAIWPPTSTAFQSCRGCSSSGIRTRLLRVTSATPRTTTTPPKTASGAQGGKADPTFLGASGFGANRGTVFGFSVFGRFRPSPAAGAGRHNTVSALRHQPSRTIDGTRMSLLNRVERRVRAIRQEMPVAAILRILKASTKKSTRQDAPPIARELGRA